MEGKKLTLNDIAKLSGVSKSTVSLVINNSPKVKKSTLDHVQSVIRQYGFTPSKAAQSLRAQREKIIGIIVTRLDSASENQAVQTILPHVYQHGYDALIMETLLQPERLEEHLKVLENRQVEGVIIFGFTGIASTMLRQWKDRVVLIESELSGFPRVRYDGAGAVRMLMQRMVHNGAENVSFIGVAEKDKTTGSERYQAYLQGCEQFGFIPRAALGNLTYQSGYQLAAEIVNAETRALICATDTIALGAIKFIREKNFNIEIGSIGSIPLLSFLFPEVISVRLGYPDAGREAIQLLIALLNGNVEKKKIVIPCQFVAQ
ncbi:trehalose operon repressor TreR [Pseudescherichia vulneris]|nr:trehalose operon repressor TreR [Pseudescherichia vulneris]